MSGSAIRGSRVGSGPTGAAVCGPAAPRQSVVFYCVHNHQTELSFAVTAAVPQSWDCQRCGMPAGQDHDNPPTEPHAEPYKTHLAYVKERRSDDEAEQILSDALKTLRNRRKSGDVIF